MRAVRRTSPGAVVALVCLFLVAATSPWSISTSASPAGRVDSTAGALQAGTGSDLVARSEAPNIVLILTDDQRWDSLWAMPTVRRLLSGPGVTFNNAYVTNPSCCPSRASILTGLYSHGTGVWSNTPPHGGVRAFDPTPTIATRLDAAGYETALFGKYLNGYQGDAVPPGWDEWAAINTGDSGARYTSYSLNVNGRTRRFGRGQGDYVTTELTNRAVALIRREKQPLFLYFAVPAPHSPSTPAPEDEPSFEGSLSPPRPISFNEPDVSDKAPWTRSLPPLSTDKIAAMDQRYTEHFRALLSVDRAVGRIVRALRAAGELADTMIVFTSDNGYLWGEHRVLGKYVPYEESVRVPLVIRYDRMVGTPSIESQLALNIDLAPTFARVAGLPPLHADGRSLVPILRGRAPAWRSSFLVEHLGPPGPTYCGVHGERWAYIRYPGGEEELYDLNRDPFQLDNLASRANPPAVLGSMRTQLESLCRPPPPGYEL